MSGDKPGNPHRRPAGAEKRKTVAATLSFQRQAAWVAPRYLSASEVREVVRTVMRGPRWGNYHVH